MMHNLRCQPSENLSCDLPDYYVQLLHKINPLPHYAALLLLRQSIPLLHLRHPTLEKETHLPAAKYTTAKYPSDTKEMPPPPQEGLHTLPQGPHTSHQQLQRCQFDSPSIPHIHRRENVGRPLPRRGGTCYTRHSPLGGQTPRNFDRQVPLRISPYR